jgi:hexosaminidase
MKHFFSTCILAILLSVITEAHNPILPKPQKIAYGKGSIPLKGLNIGFAGKAAPEDKFAAQHLASIIKEFTSANVPVNESPKPGSNVIFERTGNPDPLPLPDEKAGPDSRESYKIKVSPKNIRITAKSSAGLFYAVQTLIQMIEGSGGSAFIPEADIEDWPVMVYRAFMMDMSHFQLPKIEEIKNQIDFLAKYKGNQYLFYSEASIELEGYPLLMAEARYTKDQVKEIIEYAKLRHIDVVPNMELYGHLHDLFRLERYSDMSVVPHGGEFIPDDPRVKPLLDDWITQISRLFPSPFFHIGFDETWSLEFEARKRNKTPEELYLLMLKQVTDMVERDGKRAMVWADMLQKYPSIIPEASKKMYAVPWHYTAMSDERYDKLLSPFQRENIPMIVQGAIKNWNWVAPNFVTSFENTDVLIKAGKKYGAIGFIQSGWTDDPLTLMRMGFPDIAYGCIAAWQTEPIIRENFFSEYARTLYPEDVAVSFAKGLNALYIGESLITKAVGATDPACGQIRSHRRSRK